MNTDYISYISAVARAGSINKAALKLNMLPHRLSKILTNMENEFNTKLFDRTHQGISLTTDGEYFLKKFHQIDEIMTELKTHSQPNITSNTVSGKLTILCEPSFRNNYLLAAMNHFLSDYPDVQIAYYEYGHEELTEKLTNMPNTIGIVTLVKPLDERNYYQTLNISAYPLLRIMPTAIIAETSKLLNTTTEKISLCTLSKLPLVILSATDERPNESLAGKIFNVFNYSPQIKYMTDRIQVFYNLLEQGDCFSLLGSSNPENQTIKDIYPALRTLPLRENFYLELNVLINENNISILVKTFLQYLFKNRAKNSEWLCQEEYLDYSGLNEPLL